MPTPRQAKLSGKEKRTSTVAAKAEDRRPAAMAKVEAKEQRLDAIHDLLDAVLVHPGLSNKELASLGTRISIAMEVRGLDITKETAKAMRKP